MTQTEFDNKVIAIAQKEIDLMATVVDLRRQSDPLSATLEERQMVLNNVLYALKDYDITSGILSDAEIDYLFELATLTVQTTP
jgi:hypothetical protein